MRLMLHDFYGNSQLPLKIKSAEEQKERPIQFLMFAIRQLPVEPRRGVS